MSAQKSQISHSRIDHSGERFARVIDLDDEEDFEESPSKQKFVQQMREESSFLPVAAPQVEKKKIIKKVRFHDDEDIVVPNSPQKVGVKRTLNRNVDIPEEDLDSGNIEKELEAECEKDF